MNSNWKLLPAALLVAVLALAGCGGGGSTPTDTGPTPEEEANQRADEAEQRADQAEADLEAERQRQAAEKAAADAKAAQMAAAALRAALGAAIDGAVDGTTTDNPGTDYFVTVAAAGPSGLKNNDAYKEMFVSVAGKSFNKQYTLTNGSLGITGTDSAALTGISLSNVGGSMFSTTGLKTHTPNGVNSAGEARFTTSGSFHGVDGTYTCAPVGGVCSSNVNADDDLVLVGQWSFMPGNPSASVMDGRAVQYGWWTDDLGKTTHVARVFYGPKDMTAYTDFAGGGKATYKGDAVGQYAIHRGAGAENDSGMFTADATLNADFGGTGAEISGMIDGFMGADGMARDWTVALQAATIGSGAWAPAGTPNDATDNEAMTVWTMDGAKGSAGGSWRGEFYGPDATDRGTAVTPAAAAGAFSAVHGNIGNMIGSFGADLED